MFKLLLKLNYEQCSEHFFSIASPIRLTILDINSPISISTKNTNKPTKNELIKNALIICSIALAQRDLTPLVQIFVVIVSMIIVIKLLFVVFLVQAIEATIFGISSNPNWFIKVSLLESEHLTKKL